MTLNREIELQAELDVARQRILHLEALSPDRVSQPSQAYDAALYSSDPEALEDVLRVPECPEVLTETLPSPPSVPQIEGLIPAAELRATLSGIETAIDAQGELLRAIVRRLESVEATAAGARDAAIRCYEEVAGRLERGD